LIQHLNPPRAGSPITPSDFPRLTPPRFSATMPACHEIITARREPMRVFANLFLVLFVADGGISLVDELVSLLSPLPALSELRSFLANGVILMAVPVYLCLGIDRRLPKRLFLPLVLFVFWCPVSGWFFPALSDNRTYGLLAAAGQLLLCLLLISRVRKTAGRSLIMPRALFDAPFFSLRNTLIFGAANLVVIPCALVLLVFCMANAYLEEYTSGFMRLAPDGLHMIERVYRRDNRTIRLVGMIHVGEKEYYDEMVGSVAPGRTIVLAEGVTDDENLLRNRLDYGKLAGLVGLTSQQNMHFRGRQIDEEEFAASLSRAGAEGERETGRPADILKADVDVSSFRPETIRFLDALGKQLKESPSLAKGLLACNARAEKNITPAMQKVIMDDILYRRNEEVIRRLRQALARYDTIVIPWGALHMTEIEDEVLEQGFELQQERERVSIDFRKMLKGK
jgi:hypothetical protein